MTLCLYRNGKHARAREYSTLQNVFPTVYRNPLGSGVERGRPVNSHRFEVSFADFSPRQSCSLQLSFTEQSSIFPSKLNVLINDFVYVMIT
ncbi:hypothetical protein FKM82_016066 [Ascaphus truei]